MSELTDKQQKALLQQKREQEEQELCYPTPVFPVGKAPC